MSTVDSAQGHPFENPFVRYALGLSGAAIIALIAVLYLEGTVQYLALGLAVVDAAVVPKVLERAVEADAPA